MKYDRLLRIMMVLYAATLVVSCTKNKNLVHKEFQPVNKKEWKWTDSKKFNFTISESDFLYDVNVLLRIDGSYAYSDIWLKAVTKINGKLQEKQIQIVLADVSGKWLGEGSTRLLSYKTNLYKDIKLDKGNSSIEIFQNTRDGNAAGVNDIGIEIIKKDRKF